MLDTAFALLRERGNDEFTLQDVAKRGRVSIGSIYFRFESKDELIRAVHVRTLQRMREDEVATLARIAERGRNLTTLVPLLVEEVSEMLKRHVPSLAPIMARAPGDAGLAQYGSGRYLQFAGDVEVLLLKYADEICRPDPPRAAAAAFTLFYSTVARFLGLGMAPATEKLGDWTRLKEDISDMLLAYLTLGGSRNQASAIDRAASYAQ